MAYQLWASCMSVGGSIVVDYGSGTLTANINTRIDSKDDVTASNLTITIISVSGYQLSSARVFAQTNNGTETASLNLSEGKNNFSLGEYYSTTNSVSVQASFERSGSGEGGGTGGGGTGGSSDNEFYYKCYEIQSKRIYNPLTEEKIVTNEGITRPDLTGYKYLGYVYHSSYDNCFDQVSENTGDDRFDGTDDTCYPPSSGKFPYVIFFYEKKKWTYTSANSTAIISLTPTTGPKNRKISITLASYQIKGYRISLRAEDGSSPSNRSAKIALYHNDSSSYAPTDSLFVWGTTRATMAGGLNENSATAQDAISSGYYNFRQAVIYNQGGNAVSGNANYKVSDFECSSSIGIYAAFNSLTHDLSDTVNLSVYYSPYRFINLYQNTSSTDTTYKTETAIPNSAVEKPSFTLPSNSYFTRSGYTLTGWNTAANGLGTSYNCGQTLTKIGSDLTLYAQWKINKYEVRFCNNTGVNLSTVTCDPGSSITMAAATTAPAINVEQLGWSIINNSAYRDWNATLGNGEYACGATYTPTASLTTFYPIWKYKEQYIEFFDTKGNFNNSNTTTNSWNMNTKNSYDLSTYTNYKFSLCYNHHGDSERADYKKWPQFYSLLKDWTLINAPSGNFMTMCYGKDRFVGLGTGQAAFIYSRDGIEWTKKELSSSCYWNSICYSEEKNLFVGTTSFYPSSQIGYSSDGMSWTIQDLDLSYQKEEVGLDSLAAGNNIFLAIVSINSTNDFYYTNQIARSVDGINWELKTLPETASWEKIQFLNNKFILNDSTGKVYYSTDGITWSLCSISNNAWSKFCFGNDIYLGVSSTSQEIAYSSDGITWNIQPSTIGTIDEIMFDGKKFIAVNKTRKKLYYSYLGKQWNEESINFTSSTVGNITLITGNGQLLLTEGYGHDIYRAASKTINYRFTGFSKTRGTLKPEYHSNSTIDLTPYNNKSVIPLYAVWQPYFRFEDKNSNMLIDGYNGRMDDFITTLQMNELFNYFSDYGNYETVIPKTAYLNKKTRIASGQFTTPDSYLVSNNTRMKSTDFYLLQKCYNSLNEDPINKNFTSPLTFTPVNPEDTITIKLKKVGSPTNSVYRWYYSSNAGLFGFLLPNDDSITLSNGNNVCLMPWFSSNLNALSTDSSNYYQFEITGGLVKVSGSVLSLINISEDEQLPDYCFYNLFKDCTNIITAPELPSLKIGVGSYQGMFQGCTRLTIPPSLPATTLGNNCYSTMFQGCTSLKVAPNLPATTLTSNCYSAMLKDCISLKVAPKLPATTLETNSYLYMFFNCSNLEDVPFIGASTLNGTNEFGAMFNHCTNLKHIKLAYTGNFSNSHFGGWVNDVASNGILEYNGEDTAVGVDAIPSGWTVKKST